MVCRYGKEAQHTIGRTTGCQRAFRTCLDTRHTCVDCDGIVWYQLHWKMVKRQILQKGPLPTSPPTTAVVADELLRQLHTKISDGLILRGGSVVLVQHKCICYGDIKQEVKNILVELSTLSAAAVIASELIASIHPSRKLVSDDGFRIWHWNLRSILLPPKDCTSCCQLCWLISQ